MKRCTSTTGLRAGLLCWCKLCCVGLFLHAALSAGEMPAASANIPAGMFRPLFAKADDPAIAIRAYKLDRHAVSNGEFLEFVRATPLVTDLHKPVTQVSWFAARAYCRWREARLPTTAEWEWAALFHVRYRQGANEIAHSNVLSLLDENGVLLAQTASGVALDSLLKFAETKVVKLLLLILVS